MKAAIRAIEYYLPEAVLTNEELSREFPMWTPSKMSDKLGITERRIAAPDQCSSDLAVEAAQRLFASGACEPASIDYLLLCTQSPDFFLPTTACIIQERLKLPTIVGALDFNLGCSGFVYGVGLAQGLIETGQASRVLLLTAETYSKFIHRRDKSVRTLFGDAAAATLLEAVPSDTSLIGPYVWGTDGRGAGNLIVPAGGMRCSRSPSTAIEVEDDNGNVRTRENLFMDGGEIFNFTLEAVPDTVTRLLERSRKSLDDIDLFFFHQANRYMLDHLRKRMKIPQDKFYVAMNHCGNTVSSTIPIAMKHALAEGRLRSGHLTMLVGFGVGYSWGGALLRWV